jgi:type VI secretion system protein ImpL
VFVSNMQQGFVKPCKYKLESQLRAVRGDEYLKERNALKTYLMISEVEHLDVDWATGKYTNLWAELHEQTSDVALPELKKQMRRHIQYYFELLKQKKVTPVLPNQAIVKKARGVLQAVPVRKRYYSMFVDVLSHEKYDPAGDRSRANSKYPSIRLDDLFRDRPEVLKFLSSKTYKKSKTWLEVQGPYTDKGHYAVLGNIKEGAAVLEREGWVVPLSAEERGDRVAVNIAKLSEDYEQRYVASWKDFMLDLEVEPPGSIKEAIDLYAGLRAPEWPYLRVLRNVEDHTQWKRDQKSLQNDGANKAINRRLNQEVTRRTRGLRFNVDVKKIAGRLSVVPGTFKKTVAVGVPQDGSAGPASAPLTETPLAQYMELLGKIREKMVVAEDKQPGVGVQVIALDLQNAMKEAEALLQPADDMARTALTALFANPLNVGGKIRPTRPSFR